MEQIFILYCLRYTCYQIGHKTEELDTIVTIVSVSHYFIDIICFKQICFTPGDASSNPVICIISVCHAMSYNDIDREHQNYN